MPKKQKLAGNSPKMVPVSEIQAPTDALLKASKTDTRKQLGGCSQTSDQPDLPSSQPHEQPSATLKLAKEEPLSSLLSCALDSQRPGTHRGQRQTQSQPGGQ